MSDGSRLSDYARHHARLAAVLARPDFKDGPKAVYTALWNHADNASGVVRRSEDVLAAACAKASPSKEDPAHMVPTGAFHRGIKVLTAKGIIETLKSARRGHNYTVRRLRDPGEFLPAMSGGQSDEESPATSGGQSGITRHPQHESPAICDTNHPPSVADISLCISQGISQQKQSAAAAEEEEEEPEDQTPEALPEPLEAEPEGEQPDAATVYAAFPRKVGRQAALTKIDAAAERLAKEGATEPHQHLLEQTRAYAAAVKPLLEQGADRGLIPHPATWYGQGRYDDDPAEWPVTLERSLRDGRPREAASSHKGGADSGTRPRDRDPMPKARALLEEEGIGEPNRDRILDELREEAIAAGAEAGDIDGDVHDAIRSVFCNLSSGAKAGLRVIELKQNGAKEVADVVARRLRRRQWEQEKHEAEQRRQQEERAAAEQARKDAAAFVETETAATLAARDYDRLLRRLKARTDAGRIPSTERLARQHLEAADERFGLVDLELAPEQLEPLAVAAWNQRLEAEVANARAKREDRRSKRERRKKDAEKAREQAERDRKLTDFRDGFDAKGAAELYRRFAEKWPLPAKTMSPTSDSFWEAAHDAVNAEKLDLDGIERTTEAGSSSASATAADVPATDPVDPAQEQRNPAPTSPPPAAPTPSATSSTRGHNADAERETLRRLQAAKATSGTGATSLAAALPGGR